MSLILSWRPAWRFCAPDNVRLCLKVKRETRMALRKTAFPTIPGRIRTFNLWLRRPGLGFARITKLTAGEGQAYIHVRKRAIDLQNPVYLYYYLNIRQLQATDAKLRNLINKLKAEV